jgi:hypothetical protein
MHPLPYEHLLEAGSTNIEINEVVTSIYISFNWHTTKILSMLIIRINLESYEHSC